MIKPSYNYEELEQGEVPEVSIQKNARRAIIIYFAGIIVCCTLIIVVTALYAKVGTPTRNHVKTYNYSLEYLNYFIQKEIHGCNRTFRILTSDECIQYYNDRHRRRMYEDDDDVGCGETDTTVPIGQICEGDGECGTDDNLNNCHNWDVYMRINY
tara:strand:- start:3601 stop:4065 length:465 start_codon:yes stop_codon:yes gene_type:complete